MFKSAWLQVYQLQEELGAGLITDQKDIVPNKLRDKISPLFWWYLKGIDSEWQEDFNDVLDVPFTLTPNNPILMLL